MSELRMKIHNRIQLLKLKIDGEYAIDWIEYVSVGDKIVIHWITGFDEAKK